MLLSAAPFSQLLEFIACAQAMRRCCTFASARVAAAAEQRRRRPTVRGGLRLEMRVIICLTEPRGTRGCSSLPTRATPVLPIAAAATSDRTPSLLSMRQASPGSASWASRQNAPKERKEAACVLRRAWMPPGCAPPDPLPPRIRHCKA